MTTSQRRQRTRLARGFTLVEVMVAALITILVLGSISLSLARIGRAKSTSKERLDTYLRADAALAALRREVVSVMRADDLFVTRFLLYDDAISTPLGDMDRDELLVFNTRLRPVRNTDNFSGEGIEYETQVRVEEDDAGSVLWQRRDRVPDEYPLGGGKATPLVDGIVGLMIEAYDGRQWSGRWDSDEQGLPHAVRIMVTASGHRGP
ncbi:MAG: prepilin-type N-terminal cleavage/methylation domain-containing protein, partial [Phycisphaerae bacterium]|nr:prepilin-type N-terminal cleavage/methylation domain-containing protein [Phycisphaerae bacterium]